MYEILFKLKGTKDIVTATYIVEFPLPAPDTQHPVCVKTPFTL
jgi:hypothetical protein